MFRRRILIWSTATAGVVVAAVLLALFQPWQLFTTTEVHDVLPVAAGGSPSASVPASAAAASPSVTAQTPASASAASTSASSSASSSAASSTASSVAPTVARSVAPTPGELGMGTFVSYEHKTTGTARLLRLADGSLLVRLEHFSTSNGPDVRVWLSDRPATAASDADSGAWFELGPLKGNKGELNYPVATGTEISRYRSVVVWCRRFSVAFGAAPISG